MADICSVNSATYIRTYSIDRIKMFFIWLILASAIPVNEQHFIDMVNRLEALLATVKGSICNLVTV